MFHPLCCDISIEHPTLFTNPFDYEPHPLVELAREELCRYIEASEQWHAEIEQGKMFGVLVVENQRGELGFLAAFSGYLAKRTIHPYFVPPVVNLLDPNGFFATEEANISEINRQVSAIDSSSNLASAREALAAIAESQQLEIEQLYQEYSQSRAQRRQLRLEGCSAEKLAVLSAESQRQKGAIRRRELHFRTLREPLERTIADLQNRRTALIEERQKRSAALQRLTFSRFEMLNAAGEKRNLIDIFEQYNRTVPPAGSGECAAPKLLHYAYANELKPIAMGEFWWGNSTRGEVRRHMHYYPACRGKCHPILSFMLQGLEVEPPRKHNCEEQIAQQLEVIYEDEHLVAFNKPSGLPSVRGLNHEISVQSIAEELYPHVNPNNLIVHRLDMDTSGVLIIAKSAQVQSSLQQQFALHTIRKRYIALLEGSLPKESGSIDLPLVLDPLDRPRQQVDFEIGKPAFTFYSLIALEGQRSRVALHPQTGRTHQLRVHCAHPAGLNTPIVGDRLYGSADHRLMLHAEQITLQHPATGRKFTLRCAPGF